MVPLRSLLSIIVAAVLLAGVGAGPAWGWGVTAQKTLTGVTNADRAVVDSDGTIYLLDQFGARKGSRPYTTRYDVRVTKVSGDLATVDTSLPSTASEGFGPYADPVFDIYSTLGLSPSGFAIDRGLRRIYVSTGDGVSVLSLDGTPSWRTLVAGGWYSRGLVAGAVAVDPVTHHVFVADYGAIIQCFLDPFDCLEPAATGALTVREYDSTGTLVGTVPLPQQCTAGLDPGACPLGTFAQSYSANYAAFGPTAMDFVDVGGASRLAVVQVSRRVNIERTVLTLIDPATGAVESEIGTGVGTRPLGLLDSTKSPNAQSLDFAAVGDGSYVLPEIGAGPGADGLVNLTPDGRVLSRFMARGGASCALVSPRSRLASAPGTRVVSVEDTSPVRITVLDKAGAGCPELPVTPRQPPTWSTVAVSASAAATGGDARDIAATDGGTVALPIPRDGEGRILTIERDYQVAFPEPVVDPDNGGADKGPWGTCSLSAPGLPEKRGTLEVDPLSGCSVNAQENPWLELPPLAFVRPLPVTLTVVDDDGDRTTWTLRIVSTESLRAALAVEAVESDKAVFRFTLDRTCDRDACTEPSDFTQLSTGPIDTWELDFGDGTTTSGDWRDLDRAVEHTYAGSGTYTPKLTLRAAGKPDATITKSITVDRADTSVPVPALAVSPATAVQGTAMTFSPSDSGTGTIASWTLDFGDGDQATGTGADFGPRTHTYRAAGTYAPRLTIQLVNGRSAAAGATVTVTERPRDVTTAAEQTVIKSCLTVFGVPLGVLGLGDERLCSADPCDVDVAQLGLTQVGFQRPATCDAGAAITDFSGTGEAVELVGARPRIVARTFTLARDGRIAVRVRCLPGAGTCAGTITVDLRPGAGGTRRLGTTKFTRLEVGRTRTLKIRPSVKRRRELATEDRRRRRRGQKARIRVRSTPATPGPGVERPRSDTLLAPIRISRSKRSSTKRTAPVRRAT